MGLYKVIRLHKNLDQIGLYRVIWGERGLGTYFGSALKSRLQGTGFRVGPSAHPHFRPRHNHVNIITMIAYSSFHFLFHYPDITPIIYYILST